MIMRMTLTEALAKLKMYNKRVEKLTYELDDGKFLIDYVIGNNNKGQKTRMTAEELKQFAQSRIDKLNAVIKNRNKLKGVIAQTNAVTKVKVGDKEYTIVQAIERKNSLDIEKTILSILENQVAIIKNQVVKLNEQAQQKANEIVEAQVQSEVKNKKTEEIEALYNLIYEKNKAEILDPAKIEQIVEKMREDIETFEQNIDVALSIVNANTFIEVDFDEE
jgi:hypothetical protein